MAVNCLLNVVFLCCYKTYFPLKINENEYSLFRLENWLAFGSNLENLARLKNSIMEC